MLPCVHSPPCRLGIKIASKIAEIPFLALNVDTPKLTAQVPEKRFEFQLLSWLSDKERSSAYRGHGFRGSKRNYV